MFKYNQYNLQYGVPSDHSTVAAVPLAQGKVLETREYISRTFIHCLSQDLKSLGSGFVQRYGRTSLKKPHLQNKCQNFQKIGYHFTPQDCQN